MAKQGKRDHRTADITRRQGIRNVKQSFLIVCEGVRTEPEYFKARFTIRLPNGQPNYTVEFVNGRQVRKVRVNRPKALCFDYRQLKNAFGLDLETEVITDMQDIRRTIPKSHKIKNRDTFFILS